MNTRTIALVVIGDVGQEPLAIRSTLEYFGFRVIYYPIGRPNDFIQVLTGQVLYDNIWDIIICAHGSDGAIMMPVVAEEIYETTEPHNYFTADVILRFGNLSGKTVLMTGCGLGNDEMAKAFLTIGCNNFIGASGEVEGNAALIFVQLFYYHIITGLTAEHAYLQTTKIDDETALFNLYRKS